MMIIIIDAQTVILLVISFFSLKKLFKKYFQTTSGKGDSTNKPIDRFNITNNLNIGKNNHINDSTKKK